MSLVLVLPIIIPMLSGVLTLLAFRSRIAQRAVSMAGSVALALAAVLLLAEVAEAGIRVDRIGNWPAPYGITLVADLFSAVMIVLTALIGAAVAFYSLVSIDQRRETFGYHPLFQFLIMGVCGAFLTGDLFNLYVWFEVMLMSSFVLMALGAERRQMEGAIKYVTLNLLSSALFLAALGLLYGTAGTLNMADLARKFATLTTPESQGLVTTLGMLFLVAFGIKAGLFPMFFWLPASYHTPPAAVSAVFSGLLTKVGVYALIRVFTLIFIHDAALVQTVLLVIAGLTMVTGVLGAVAQYDFRRLLSFHIVSQIGYALMGLGIGSALALGGAVYFIFHVSVSKAALFLVSGLTQRLHGTYDLKQLGGLYRSQPVLALLFLVPALSLAGLPPLSGFFAKLSLVRAGLEAGQYLSVAVALGVSLLTLFSMIKIWVEAFWKPLPETGVTVAVPIREWLPPLVLLAAVAIGLGLGAGPAFALASRAGAQLLDPAAYIAAVLPEVR
ncbi:MAG TPA: Na+/H+ antiporter subunit D [Anaerolineales bacterium]|nr:Na+/H+ antiporter subunit D [Anaerolineales bacterium]HRF50674.1 Na+/H+ antiporter subunit D [Anaerolineales bacterium]